MWAFLRHLFLIHRSHTTAYQPEVAVAGDLGMHRLTFLPHQSKFAAADALDELSVSVPIETGGKTPVEDKLCKFNSVWNPVLLKKFYNYS